MVGILLEWSSCRKQKHQPRSLSKCGVKKHESSIGYSTVSHHVCSKDLLIATWTSSIITRSGYLKQEYLKV